MNDKVAIKVENISKKYCKSLKRSMFYGIKDIGKNMLGMSSHSENLRNEEFWALGDVSFEVKKGETLGIIGPNGSGKTTLLKLLNGIFWPDKGKVTIKGKVGALIEVGAGFHPLLTGRENVYLNAAILGMTKKEVDEKFDSIVEFADIGDFIDAPVKFYSSGMFVRLGFAVAVHCEPEILLVDEVLAVGDLFFRRKCFNKMNEVKSQGTSIVIVSHDIQNMQFFCNRLSVLHKGKIVYAGRPDTAIEEYNKVIANQQHKYLNLAGIDSGKDSLGTVKIISVTFLNSQDKPRKQFCSGEEMKVKVEFQCFEKIKKPIVAFAIYNSERLPVCRERSIFAGYKIASMEDTCSVTISFLPLQLNTGVYNFGIAIFDENMAFQYIYCHDYKFKVASFMPSHILGNAIFHPRVSWKFKNIPVKFNPENGYINLLETKT